MSIAKHARASDIMNKMAKGYYVKQYKFHNFGSVVEDSILAQQKEADERLRLLRLARQKS